MAPVTKPSRSLGPTFIKEWREYRAVRQQDAADAIDVSRSLLSKIEKSKSPYSQAYLEGLAALYRCTPADLLVRDPRQAEDLWTIWTRVQNSPEQVQKRIKAVVMATLSSD